MPSVDKKLFKSSSKSDENCKFLQNYITFNAFFSKKSGKISQLDLWQPCNSVISNYILDK